ncbi:MAG TPA: hypothetical protein VMX18_01570 [Candidatus Bipolaricaulota bacterium]|nr:hypothetical protein [Candidatus Bipolaricaulota bacterium]
MSAVIDWFTTIDWVNPSWDLIVLLFFTVGALLYGIAMGRSRIIVVLLSLYITLAIAYTIPWSKYLKGSISINNAFVLQATVFIILLVVCFFLISRSAVGRVIGDSSGAWWQVIVFSFLQIGLLISVIFTFLPSSFLNNFSFVTREVFVSDIGRLVWLGLPILAMMLVKEKEE